mmetsp:Transcript_30153/g.65875  ORF Transcript_30153/g.65875 Transcript_30153/m.65875 type:complete len:489 (-) Transcript_30153:134-1600(-)
MAFTRAKTQNVDKGEVDFMVVSYSCLDGALLTGFGSHSKVTKWRVLPALNAEPINISVEVDTSAIMAPKVGIQWNGKRLYPETGTAGTGKLKQDFTYRCPFRSIFRGIGQRGLFEIKPRIFEDAWFPGTVISQRSDGLFEAVVEFPDGVGGYRETNFPAVKQEQIREVRTGHPIVVVKSELLLSVPHADPLKATLTVDGEELHARHFARPTPRPEKADGPSPSPQMFLKVDKLRKNVSVPGGHSNLRDWLDGEPKLVSQASERLKRSWTFQLGPYGEMAEHTVTLEKKWTKGKVITLSIDDIPLVEAAASDFKRKADQTSTANSEEWGCDFRFVGEKLLSIEVHETDRDGNALDSTGMVQKRTKYVHNCSVHLTSMSDLREAVFKIGGRNFRELPERPPKPATEADIQITPQVLLDSYQIAVPFKTNDKVQLGLLNNLGLGEMSGVLGNPGSMGRPAEWQHLLFGCCKAPQVSQDAEHQIDTTANGGR